MFIFKKGLISLLIIVSSVWAQSPQTETAQTGIAIRVVEGEGAINSIRLRRAREPLVQVLDRSGEPIEGATVSFVLPATGASGFFGASGLSLTTQTDARGMAVGVGLRPNQIAGQFRIRATASSRGATAAATLTQTNAEPVSASSSKKIAIVALIAAGVAGGILAGAIGGASSAAAAGPTGATTAPPVVIPGSITAGVPSFGPPR